MEKSAWRLDADSCELSNGTIYIHMTRTESRVLEAILSKQGRVATPNFVVDYVWDSNTPGRQDPRDLMDPAKEAQVFLCKIRKLLREDGVDFEIITEWGIGYRSTKIVEVIKDDLLCCPRCQRPFPPEEPSKPNGEISVERSHQLAQEARHGREAADQHRRQITGVQERRVGQQTLAHQGTR